MWPIAVILLQHVTLSCNPELFTLNLQACHAFEAEVKLHVKLYSVGHPSFERYIFFFLLKLWVRRGYIIFNLCTKKSYINKPQKEQCQEFFEVEDFIKRLLLVPLEVPYNNFNFILSKKLKQHACLCRPSFFCSKLYLPEVGFSIKFPNCFPKCLFWEADK